jgi:hypothetical protein
MGMAKEAFIALISAEAGTIVDIVRKAPHHVERDGGSKAARLSESAPPKECFSALSYSQQDPIPLDFPASLT